MALDEPYLRKPFLDDPRWLIGVNDVAHFCSPGSKPGVTPIDWRDESARRCAKCQEPIPAAVQTLARFLEP